MATIYIAHASISENGTTEGTKGDSTGKEVCKRTWYSKPWDFMAIFADEDVREDIATTGEDAAANDNIGYGQSDRNTLNTQAKAVSYKLSKIATKCNCDCSSLVNVAVVAAGKGSYGSNGWTTSTLKAKLKALGAVIITDSTYLTSSAYCVRGAIYCKEGSHTVIGLTNGSSYKKTLSKAGISTTSTSVSTASSTSTSTSKKTASDAAKSYNKSLAGTYKVTASSGLNIRNGAGTSKSKMVTIPQGTTVKNYGYYTKVGTVKWLYVQFTHKNVTYTGFGSSTYLSKQS